MQLVTSREKHTKYVMKLNFKDGYRLSKELFDVDMGKTKIKVNNPVDLGQTILEQAKH